MKNFWTREWWDAFWERWPAAEYAIFPVIWTLVWAVFLTIDSEPFKTVLVMIGTGLVVSGAIQSCRYHRRVRRLRKG